MKDANFSLEFEMNDDELYKFNCDYFKRMYEKKIKILFFLSLLPFMFLNVKNIGNEYEFIQWLILNMAVVFVFAILQPLFVNLICRILVNSDSQFVENNRMLGKYKYDFNESKISIESPVGFFTHKWSQLESVVLTKEYLLLYISKKKGYIISRSGSKCKDNRKMQELIYMVENKVCNMVRI